MTPEQENQLFQTLGEIKAGVQALDGKIENHMKSDDDRFGVVHGRIDAAKEAIETAKQNINTHAIKIGAGGAVGGIAAAIAVVVIGRLLIGG